MAFLTVLYGTGAFAQGEVSSRYAWRLDSVVYSYPLSGKEYGEYGRMGERDVELFYYGEENQPTDSAYSVIKYSEYYFTKEPLAHARIGRRTSKKEYRSFGPHGKHSVLYYTYTDDHYIDTTGGAIDPSLFALYRRDDYALDSTRLVYDENGGLLRRIHNYDLTTTKYRYTTGEITGISRGQIIATDTTEEEKQWSCNVQTGVWSMSKDLRREYTNHHLTYSESTRREYFADGTLSKIWVDGTGYNELGVKTRTYSSYKIYQEDGTPKPFQPGGHAWRENIEIFEGGRILHSADSMTLWVDGKGLTSAVYPDKDYEYLPNGMVIRTESGNQKFLIDLQGKEHLIYNQNPYFKEPYYSRYVYYDDFTLKQQVDSTLEPVFTQQGDSVVKIMRRVWTITDYDRQGRKTHMIQMHHDTTVTDWTYTREETYAQNYTETVTLQNKTRTTSRTYNYGFDNRYNLVEEQDENGNWKSKNSSCDWFNVSFGPNGEPLTAVQYRRSNEQWTPSEIYTFTYIPEWDLYRRDNFGYSGGYIEFYAKSGESRGWYLRYASGHVDLAEYDAFGRKTKDSQCSFDSAMHVKDTTYFTLYRYFPVASCTKVAESTTYRRNAETGAWEARTPTRADNYTHKVNDEKGNLAVSYTFRWEGDSIVTDTTDYELVYDERGRLYEQKLTNGNAGTVNINRKRYLYLDSDDPIAYRTLLWYEHNDPKYSGWQEGYDSDNHTQKSYDEFGRISESILFGISSDNTHAVPSDKYVYYYESDNPDWISRDHYVMRDGEWLCSENNNRRLLLSGIDRDSEGITTAQWERNYDCNGLHNKRLWVYSYAADTAAYPVLSPDVYTMRHETEADESVSEEVMPKRIKDILYTDVQYPDQSYLATYYYTPLRENVDEPRLPVAVEPEKESAVFTWGAVEGAVTYVLHVYADAAQTEEICYVVFDNTGRVQSVNFIRHAPVRTQTVAQLSYTLTQLSPGTSYWYTVEGIDSNEHSVETTRGTFTTGIDADIPTGIVDFIGENEKGQSVRKILKNGQIYLMYEGRMYDVRGNQIK